MPCQFTNFWPKKCDSSSAPPPHLDRSGLSKLLLISEIKIKGTWFHNILTIQKNVTAELKVITEKYYKYTLESLVERTQQCINLDGIYVE